MNSIQTWPNNLLYILLNEEGHSIFGYIQVSAKNCLADLTEALTHKEVNEDKLTEIEQSVSQELKDADDFRVTLIAIDARIGREKQINPVLNRYISEEVRKGRPNDNELLYDLLNPPPHSPMEAGILRTVEVLRPDANQSLRYRLQMTWCWDEILSEHRKLSVSRVIFLGHILTEGALLLQDSTTTHKVREILSSLEIKIPKEPLQFQLPSGTMELRNLLVNGSRKLERTHRHIVRLDQQRQCLRESQETMTRQIETLSKRKTQEPVTSDSSSCSGETETSKSPRMAFKSKWEVHKTSHNLKE